MELLFSILWGRSTDQRQKVQLKLTSWYPWNFRTVLEMSSWEIPRDQVLSEWQLSRWILKSVCAVRTSAKTFFLRNALSNAPRSTKLDRMGLLEHVFAILWGRPKTQRKDVQLKEHLKSCSRCQHKNSKQASGLSGESKRHEVLSQPKLSR